MIDYTAYLVNGLVICKPEKIQRPGAVQFQANCTAAAATFAENYFKALDLKSTNSHYVEWFRRRGQQ
jgi:hypothetical protein